MPIYEYWCNHCQRKVILYLSAFPQSVPACPECGNDTLQRLFSTFSVRKTSKDIYEDILSDSQLVNGMLSNNPKSLAEWNKRMSQGEKPAPEYEEMIEKMDRGEVPSELPNKNIQETIEEAK